MAVEYLDKNNDDGTCFGYTSESKISFFGTTPCNQPATIAATGLSALSTAGVVAVSAAVDSILTALKELGLVAAA
jgi:hypothetical protein